MALKRIATNAGAVVASEAFNRATTFVLYLLVARYLDDATFGRLSLALTFMYLVQVTSGFGLNTYLAREVSKRRDAAAGQLINGLVVGLAASMASLTLLVMLLLAVGYPAETTRVVLLLALTAVPYAVASICQGVFQAQERMHLIPLVNVPANLLKLAVAGVLLWRGAGLEAVVLAIVGSQILVAMANLVLSWRLVKPTTAAVKLSFGTVVRLGRDSSAFVGIDAVVALWSILPLFVLSLFVSEVEVGRFGAAVQLLVPVSLLLNGVMVAAFPLMSRSFGTDPAKLRAITHGLLAVLLTVALPATLGLMLVAPEAMGLVYGPGFAEGAVALRIMAPLIVLRAITAALGNALLAGMLERITFRIVLLNSVAAFVLGLLLVPALGVAGAALAALVAGVVNLAQHYLPAVRLLGSVRLLAVGWRPIAAGAVMCFLLIATGTDRLAPTSLGGAMVYLTVLALLYLITLGGPGGLLKKVTETWAR